MSLPAVLEKIPPHVTLVAAVKYAPDARSIRSLLDGGVRAIGENRVQDAEAHFSKLTDAGVSCEKHFIGTIQSNKIGKIARLFDVVQSLDDRAHAEKLDRAAAAEGKVLRVLVQINAGNEAQKSGLPPEKEKVAAFFRSLSGFSHLYVEGLMAVVPMDEDSRPYFKAMKRLFDSLKVEFKLTVLSMGTSHDFEAAVEEGATMVRVGRLLFQENKR
ncbi:YggS family pyridoxal phosphate-dependent enzyme [Candidatus Micrarchaeota archaeon]|nr:YggS family pyridoxal phosphate-dependent enzyme [Candidatus Micrarchaeota archaeon]